MPVYDYTCPRGHRIERVCIVGSRDDAISCPECRLVMARLMPKGTSHKWIGRILEWGKPDIIVDREEDLVDYQGQRPKDMERGQ